jgi:response regulator RpfG family c-di-GMP phosphodiesterase
LTKGTFATKGIAQMPMWLTWVLVGLAGWCGLSVVFGLVIARTIRAAKPAEDAVPATSIGTQAPRFRPVQLTLGLRERILVVDDDATLRLLLRTTLSADEYFVEEAASAEEAAQLARAWQPTLVVLDVSLPGQGGLAFCRELTSNAAFNAPIVILLTGGDTTLGDATAAGAAALLRKPFSPLELVNLIDRLLREELVPMYEAEAAETEQLFVYARDLGRLWEVERAQRRVLQQAYRQTMTSLVDALEAKHRPTRLHALRVQRLAVELTSAVDADLLDDASLEYGFLLHDIGKIGLPDAILNQPRPLDPDELQVMQQHPVVGERILNGVALLDREGMAIVRSHHERWDGNGYPDGLARDEIPLGARIFAVADAVDAMTDDRPYRRRRSWQEAVDEVRAESGRQFDPEVVARFVAADRRLQRIHEDVHPRAA